MQQPTDVIDMMTVCNEKTISPASCEKITLSRHAIVLPKIDHPSICQSSADQSVRCWRSLLNSPSAKGTIMLLTFLLSVKKKLQRHD
jgi:hypothetical protein